MKRIQRKRTNGWKMPEGAIYVGRPTVWGNPYPVTDNTSVERTIELYRLWMNKCLNGSVSFIWKQRLEKLRGHDLACWCKEGEPCHANVLIELLEATP